MACWSHCLRASGTTECGACWPKSMASRRSSSGARLALDVGSQAIKVNEMVELRDQLSERSVSLWAVISESSGNREDGAAAGAGHPCLQTAAGGAAEPRCGNGSQETALFVNRPFAQGPGLSFRGRLWCWATSIPARNSLRKGA